MSSDGFGGLPRKGDLIEVFYDGFQHWAVYVGDGYVVHLINIDSGILAGSASFTSNRGLVRKDLLCEQYKGYKYQINNKYDKKMEPLCAEDIVRRAEEMVGKKIPYSLTNYNCEHFATNMRYGVPMSDQVQDKASGVLATVGMFLATVFGLLFNGSRLPSSH